MKKELVFDFTDRNFRIRTWYRENDGDALVKITRGGILLRHFLYPAYKIWNLAAHFSDIVDGETGKTQIGYAIAGSDGLGGCVMPKLMDSARKEREDTCSVR